ASETSITNAADAKVAINGLMRKMTSSLYYGRNFLIYGDAKGGDFAIRSQGRGSDWYYSFNHSASSNSGSGFWEQIYNCILQANNLIVNIEKMEAEDRGSVALSEYKGMALTARALMYFDLVRLYGKMYNMDKASYGVPLVLEPLDASAQPTRASVEEVYTQILTDLTTAAPLLSKNKVNGYFNYYANKAIEARVHLFMDNFTASLAAAEEVINSNKYTLYSNTAWGGSWATQFGTESIFELAIYPAEGDLTTGSLGYYLLRLAKVTGAMGYFMASDYWIARMNEDPTDIRWGVMDYDESSDTRFGSCLKYVGGSAMNGDKASRSAVNIKVIRLSEMYLIAAEAALRLPTPDKVKAAGYLNQIRKRSPGLAEATDATVTVDMILDEKSKEFFAEGLRYFDMLRLNKTIEFNDEFISPAVVITHREKTLDRTFYKTILPIDQGELDANPAIKTQQNPGY
ncbi:MAG TPA: RagB/SusD family nutrient uptake outer membrane protein, partial [Bacteroidales bacterium]|nr:RagB/SusD family nutrient uptake outer membrane protein [Bacteroidales bacterium]